MNTQLRSRRDRAAPYVTAPFAPLRHARGATARCALSITSAILKRAQVGVPGCRSRPALLHHVGALTPAPTARSGSLTRQLSDWDNIFSHFMIGLGIVGPARPRRCPKHGQVTGPEANIGSTLPMLRAATDERSAISGNDQHPGGNGRHTCAPATSCASASPCAQWLDPRSPALAQGWMPRQRVGMKDSGGASGAGSPSLQGDAAMTNSLRAGPPARLRALDSCWHPSTASSALPRSKSAIYVHAVPIRLRDAACLRQEGVGVEWCRYALRGRRAA